PRREETRPGVRCSGWIHQYQRDGDRRRYRGEPNPEAVPRRGDRVAKIALRRFSGNVADGGLAKRERTVLLEIAPHQLNHAEHLVADARIAAADQSCQLIERPL